MASSSQSSHQSALALYEKALKHLHAKKFVQASKVLQQVKKEYPDEIEILALVERMQRICEDRQQSADPAKADPEALYNSGLVEHNSGNYDGAVDYFRQALEKSKSDGDYIHFALAASESRRGNTEIALKHLEKAFELNPQNRLLARRDADFEPLSEEEGFRKLVARKGRK